MLNNPRLLKVIENYKIPSAFFEFITMTPSQQAKAQGLDNLAQVVKATKTSNQTLHNWAKHKPELFEVVLIGTREKLSRESNEVQP